MIFSGYNGLENDEKALLDDLLTDLQKTYLDTTLPALTDVGHTENDDGAHRIDADLRVLHAIGDSVGLKIALGLEHVSGDCGTSVADTTAIAGDEKCVHEITADGTLVCRDDNVLSDPQVIDIVEITENITLQNTTTIEGDNIIVANQDCSDEEIYVWGFDVNGGLLCDPDDDTTYGAETNGGLLHEPTATADGLPVGSDNFFSLLDCQPGTVLKRKTIVLNDENVDVWACSEIIFPVDNDTLFEAGDGLALTGNKFRVEDCTDGSILKKVSGVWTCGGDNFDPNTTNTFEAGDGLALTGNKFRVQDCTDGSILKKVSGVWTCGGDNFDPNTTNTFEARDGVKLDGNEFDLKDCAKDQILKVLSVTNGEATYTCAADNDSPGDDTTYGAETNGGLLHEATLTADGLPGDADFYFSLLDCQPGTVLKRKNIDVNVDVWACSEIIFPVDNDTLFEAGDGLALTGNKFRVQDCTDGSILKKVTGLWSCGGDNFDPNTTNTFEAGDGLALTGNKFRVQDCTDGSILKKVSGVWTCGGDNFDPNTTNTFEAGDGLALTGNKFRVQDCTDGSILKKVSGVWTCGDDNFDPNTTNTFEAGDGLALTGNKFRVQDCTDGSILKKVSGVWTCGGDNFDPNTTNTFEARDGVKLDGNEFDLKDCAKDEILKVLSVDAGEATYTCAADSDSGAGILLATIIGGGTEGGHHHGTANGTQSSGHHRHLQGKLPTYVGMFNGAVDRTIDQVEQPMPRPGTVSNFYVRLDAQLKTDSPFEGWTFTVMHNGEPTLVECTISGDKPYDEDDLRHDGRQCNSDLSHAFAAGDTIAIMAFPLESQNRGRDPREKRNMSWTALYGSAGTVLSHPDHD